jgi:hypothetical protein
MPPSAKIRILWGDLARDLLLEEVRRRRVWPGTALKSRVREIPTLRC